MYFLQITWLHGGMREKFFHQTMCHGDVKKVDLCGLRMQLMKTEHIIFIFHTQQVQETHGIIHGESALQRATVLQADLSVLMMAM